MAAPDRRARAFEGTELPRRDSLIVVGVTAAIVGLIVLWMTQAGAASGAAPRDAAAEDSAAPSTFVAGD